MASNEINFTKASLESLLPPAVDANGVARRTVYTDKKVGGLQLRVSSSGVKTFSVLRWVKGHAKPERITLGRFPDLSVEQARNKAHLIIATIASGDNPNDERRKARAELSFADMFELYIERHARPHNRSWRVDVAKYTRFLSSPVGGVRLSIMKLSTVERSHIATLHARIGREHKIAANRVLALVSSVFGRAIEWGLYAGQNPAVGIKKFKERSRDRFLQADELPRFFAALASIPGRVQRDFLTMCLLTGARRSNVLSMRWEDVSFDRAEWRIPESQSKNAAPQLVTLSDEALHILTKRHECAKSEFVFPGPGKSGHLQEPKRAWSHLLDVDELTQLASLLKQRGVDVSDGQGETLVQQLQNYRKLAHDLHIDASNCRMHDLRIHDLRRTMGSWQAKTGASLIVIGKSLGHKSQATTQVYARLDRDPVRESVQKATQAMLGAAGLAGRRTRSA